MIEQLLRVGVAAMIGGLDRVVKRWFRAGFGLGL